MGYVLIDENQLSLTEQKAIQARRMFESGQYKSINDCIQKARISKSTYYKYRNYIPIDDEGFCYDISLKFSDIISASRGQVESSISHKKVPRS